MVENNMNDFVRLGFFQSFIHTTLDNGGRITKDGAKRLLEFIDETPGTTRVGSRMDEDIHATAKTLFKSLRRDK